MDNNYTQAYEKTFKQFVFNSLLLVIISVILGGIGYYETYPVNYFLCISIFLLAFSLAIVYIIPIKYTKKLIKVYFVFIIITLFPITVFYLSRGIGTPVFWYFPIPVFIYTAYLHIKSIKWSLFCIGLMLLAFLLSFIIRQAYHTDPFVHLSYKYLFYSDLINSFSALLSIYVYLHYLHKFHQLKINHLMDSINSSYTDDVDNLFNIDKEEEYKYTQIYTQIEKYFEEKQPYLNPDFKIVQMAHELDINMMYLAKAIKLKRDMNFSTFVNTYRIAKVKELINNVSRRYTLKYIYLSSGFKNQSSFNKAFKLSEGITPSEYYKQNNIEKEA